MVRRMLFYVGLCAYGAQAVLVHFCIAQFRAVKTEVSRSTSTFKEVPQSTLTHLKSTTKYIDLPQSTSKLQ